MVNCIFCALKIVGLSRQFTQPSIQGLQSIHALFVPPCRGTRQLLMAPHKTQERLRPTATLWMKSQLPLLREGGTTFFFVSFGMEANIPQQPNKANEWPSYSSGEGEFLVKLSRRARRQNTLVKASIDGL